MDGKILLVEDEPTNMTILAAYLRMAEYEVIEAADGKIAWDLLSNGPVIDLIVTDRRMPNMDGLELAQRVNHDARLKNVPIIMQTGATSQEEIQEGVKAGVFYYLAKPYEEETLLDIVRAALKEKQRNSLFEQNLKRQRAALDSFVKGEFHVKTPQQAENVALLIGGMFPRPELAVTGLYELILNGIEHGNLGIGYEKKSALLSEKQLDGEIAARLIANPAKKVSVQFIHEIYRINVVITDDGPGFDPRSFLEIEPSRATKGSGRGIAKASLVSFDELEYLGKGNSVKVSTRL